MGTAKLFCGLKADFSILSLGNGRIARHIGPQVRARKLRQVGHHSKAAWDQMTLLEREAASNPTVSGAFGSCRFAHLEIPAA